MTENEIKLKFVEKVVSVHKKQVLTYLKLTGIKLGLLINFDDELMKTGYSRIILGDLGPLPSFPPVPPCPWPGRTG